MSRQAQRRKVFGLSLRRIARETGWSLLIVGVLTSGLVAWILIPSVASSLESSVSNYSNGVGTYFVVNTSGSRCNLLLSAVSCARILPRNVTDDFAAIPGVQKVYPIILNLTTLIEPCSGTAQNGSVVTYPDCHISYTAGLLGGQRGFPTNLLALSSGRLPRDQPEFAASQTVANLSEVKTVTITCLFCPGTSPTEFGNITDPFSATDVGEVALNPIFVNVFILWNSTFMLHKLGPTLYRQTWESNGSNYVIVKVDSLADVPRVVNATEQLIRAPQYGLFGVMYDQALSQSLQSLTTQTAPLYQLIGIVSLIAVVGVSVLVSHLIAGRRDWEAGVYLTQGWTWRDVYILYSIYFLVLSLAAFAIAVVVSTFASHYFTATYDVYGTFTTFTATVDPFYLVTGLAFAIALAFFASYTIVRRQRRMGLDSIVRAY